MAIPYQGKSLRDISKEKGWDATRIWDQEKGQYVDSIEAWDHPRGVFDRSLGEVPDGVPAHDQKKDTSGGPKMAEKVTWEVADTSRERRENGHPKMSLSDPDEAMPGAS